MPTDNATLKSIEIKDDECLKISIKPKKSLGSFQAIGRITSMYSKKPEPTDIFDLLNKVSKTAYDLFNQIKNNRDPENNIAFLPIKELTKSQSVMQNKRLKELKDQGIIKKAKTIDKTKPIKKGSYMINPGLIMCPANQDAAEAVWNLLK